MKIYYTDGFEGGRELSRELLTRALSLHTGQPEASFTIFEGDKGKPYIEGGPEFSVSHSGGYWAVLIDERPCGIDLQVPRCADFVKIARRYYSEKEAGLVELLGEDVFFKLWTRREALVKCVGGSVFADEVPELLIPAGEDVLKLYYEGGCRSITDMDLPIPMYAAICRTVDEEWTAKREAPGMKRLAI